MTGAKLWLAVLVVATGTVLCRADFPGELLDTPERFAAAVRHVGLDPAEIVNPIAVTKDMKEFARLHATGQSPTEQLSRLQTSFFEGGRFSFEYEASTSLTAREAFESRRGNCVSFTNLFIALARAQGIPVRAALLRLAPKAERDGDLVIVNTHIVAAYPHGGRVTVYDFYRLREDIVAGLKVVDDLTVSAVYHNNRAVQFLRAGEVAEAHREIERAVKLSPRFAPALANLGVILRREGDSRGAFDAYRRALETAPRDPTVLGNLASLYSSLGMEREARGALALADTRDATSYALIVRGDLELADGQAAAAIRFYRMAARRDVELLEPWLGIARAEIARHRPAAARRAAEKALERDPASAVAAALLDSVASPTSDR